MMLVAAKYYLKHPTSKDKIDSETYRFISVVCDGSSFYAICERLSDEIVPDNCTVYNFKGDIISVKIENLKVIKNTDPVEDEMERQAYLKELNILVKG